MRQRTWVLVLLGFLVFTLLGMYIGWRAVRANDKIKTLLISRIQPFMDQDSGIDSLEINLSSIRMQGVRLNPKNQAFSLDITGIEIGYQFWNMIRYGFSPQHIANEIMLIHPVLTIHERETPAISQPDSSWPGFQKFVEEFSTVKSLTVLDAEVIIADSVHQITLGYDLDGWIQTNPVDSARLRLSGRFLESDEKNLNIDAKINLQRFRPTYLSWSVDPSVPPETVPVLVPDFIRVKSGILSGSGEFIQGKSHHGNIELKNGAFCFQNHPFCFEDVHMLGRFHGDTLSLAGNIGQFNGSALTITGSVSHLLSPQFEAKVRCNNFQLEPFFQRLIPESKLQIQGRGWYQLNARGPLNNPRITGTIQADYLTLSKIAMQPLTCRVSLQDSVLSMTAECGQDSACQMAITNRIDFSDPDYTSIFNLDLQGDYSGMLPESFRRYFHQIQGQTVAELSGPLSNMAGELNGSMLVDSRNGTSMRLTPKLNYRDHQLDVDIRSNGSFLLQGKISRFLGSDQTWQMNVYGTESFVENFVNTPALRWLERETISAELNGHSQGYSGSIRGISQTDEPVWMLNLDTKYGEQEHILQCNGTFYPDSARPLPIESRWIWGKQNVRIEHLNLGQMVQFSGEIPFSDQSELNLSLIINSLPLEDLHVLYPQSGAVQGNLIGSANINGTRASPVVSLDVTFSKGRFHEMNGFSGQLWGEWEKNAVRNFGCVLKRQDQIIIEGQVHSSARDSVKGAFTGRSLDMAQLITAFSGRDWFEGLGNLNLQFRGASDRPVLQGSLNISEGRYRRLRFDSLQVILSDTFKSGWGPGESNLRLNGQMDRSDNLHMQFSGQVPLSPSEDMDITIQVKGDILHGLSEIVDFLWQGEGRGEAMFRIGGRPDSPVLGGSSISLKGGSVRLADFVQEIHNIQLTAQMQPENQFFQISSCTGMIRNRSFRIWNQNRDIDLPPLMFENLGIHFGTLCIVTDKQGIRMHVPGLMEKRDEGMIAFSGLTKDQPFFISGGLTGPTFMGTMHLNNVRLTYPLYRIGENNSSDAVLNFLQHATWDIQLHPGSDVHYVRSIESPLGNIYTDLQLKKDYGRLHIQGTPDEGRLEVWGNLESTEGNIEVFDLVFRPEQIKFDYPQGTVNPLVSGRAYTTVIDSTGIPSTIWLTLTTVDDATGLEKEGGSWKNIVFRFSTDNPNLARNEADLLAAMGYSTSQIRERAYDALGLQVENIVFRPIFRPLEREIRRYLGLDVVRFSSKFSSNLIQLRAEQQPVFDPKYLFRSSRVILGKYLAPGLFITYSGQLQTAWKYQYHDEGLGFRHSLSLEYTFRPDLFLEMEYTYDSKLLADRREDKRIWLRHVFPF
jgi:hypothetical protein